MPDRIHRLTMTIGPCSDDDVREFVTAVLDLPLTPGEQALAPPRLRLVEDVEEIEDAEDGGAA